MFGLESYIVKAIVGALIGGGISSYQARKTRKSRKRMADKQLKMQKKQAKAAADAERASRTPPPARNQQLAVQSTPTKAGGLSISGRKTRGKGGLRVGSSGNYGVRV